MKPKGANLTPSFEVLQTTAHSVEGNALQMAVTDNGQWSSLHQKHVEKSLKKRSGVLRGRAGYGAPVVLEIFAFLKEEVGFSCNVYVPLLQTLSFCLSRGGICVFYNSWPAYVSYFADVDF